MMPDIRHKFGAACVIASCVAFANIPAPAVADALLPEPTDSATNNTDWYRQSNGTLTGNSEAPTSRTAISPPPQGTRSAPVPGPESTQYVIDDGFPDDASGTSTEDLIIGGDTITDDSAASVVDSQAFPTDRLPGNRPSQNDNRLAHTGVSGIQQAQWLALIAGALGLACLLITRRNSESLGRVSEK